MYVCGTTQAVVFRGFSVKCIIHSGEMHYAGLNQARKAEALRRLTVISCGKKSFGVSIT